MNQDKTKLPTGSGQEIGGSGTYFYKGYITAEEYSIDLQGKYGLQVYDVMRKSDPTIHAILNVCKQPILGAHWSIEPASDDPKDQEIAERANYEFFDRNIVFTDVMREGLTMLDFGFFIAELVYEITEYEGIPYIGFKKIASRKQRSILKFAMDDDNPGVTQQLPNLGTAVNIPRNKMLYAVNDQEGENYFGVSMLRYAYKPWKIKDGLEIMNAVALENQGMGIPYIKKGINGQATDEGELKTARSMLRQQRLNEEAFWEYPASLEIGFTDMKGHTTKDILPTIEYQDKQITLSVLAQFLELGQTGGSGSRAVSQDHSRLFVKALIAVARNWQKAFQRDVIDQWVDLNYSGLQNGKPKLIFSTISDEDVAETATAVAGLMQVGAITKDRDIENRLRSLLNLPALSTEAYEDYDANHAAPDVNAPVTDKEAQPDPKGTPDDPNKTGTDIPLEDDTSIKTDRETLEKAKEAEKQLLAALARV
jgi:phage gp29-like protein